MVWRARAHRIHPRLRKPEQDASPLPFERAVASTSLKGIASGQVAESIPNALEAGLWGNQGGSGSRDGTEFSL